MSKVLTVIRKEYLERVKSKAFLIGTLIGPIFMAALVLGVSEGTVSWRMSEVRKRLRALKEKELNG